MKGGMRVGFSEPTQNVAHSLKAGLRAGYYGPTPSIQIPPLKRHLILQGRATLLTDITGEDHVLGIEYIKEMR